MSCCTDCATSRMAGSKIKGCGQDRAQEFYAYDPEGFKGRCRATSGGVKGCRSSMKQWCEWMGVPWGQVTPVPVPTPPPVAADRPAQGEDPGLAYVASGPESSPVVVPLDGSAFPSVLTREVYADASPAADLDSDALAPTRPYFRQPVYSEESPPFAMAPTTADAPKKKPLPLWPFLLGGALLLAGGAARRRSRKG